MHLAVHIPAYTHTPPACTPPAPPSTLSPPGTVHVPAHMSHTHAQASPHMLHQTRCAYISVPHTHMHPQMPPSESMCNPHTYAHPAHVYMCLTHMHTSHTHCAHPLHPCTPHLNPAPCMPPSHPRAQLHACKPPMCPLTQPPSPHSFPCPTAQFRLTCACALHGDMDTWHTPTDTPRPHTHLPHVPTLLYIPHAH